MLPLCGATPQPLADPDKAWLVFLAIADIHRIEIPQRVKVLLLKFAARLADGAFTIAYDGPSTPAKEMSSRAAKIRKILQVISDPYFPSPGELDIFEVRCKALEGDLEEVEAILDACCSRSLTSEHMLDATPIIQISQAILHAIDTLEHPGAAYDWLVSRWGILEQYLWTKSGPVYSRAHHTAVSDFRDAVASIVERIEIPEGFLAKRIRSRPDGPWKEVGEHFIDVFCDLKLPREALGVMRQMAQLAITPSLRTRLLLLRALVRGKWLESAHELYAQVCKEVEGVHGTELREVWSTGLYLHAMEGKVERAEELFRRLEQQNWVHSRTLALMLHVTAVKGLVKATAETFERFFPRTESSRHKPSKAHYTEVLFAYAQAGDMDHIHEWIKRMIEDNITPDDHTYGVLVKGLSISRNTTSLFQLLERMKSSGVTFGLYGYTTLISFLAKTGDSVGAERTYQRAVKQGIKPDIKILNALMFAHVQAEYWQGVIEVFGYIKNLPGKRYRPATSTYNTLLKAYVLVGSSFSTVRDLVVELEAIGTRPDVRTFALLVQSACDNEEFEAALGLLGHMDKLTSKTRLDLEVTVYVLTILMGSFLRNGDKTRAREMYELMRARNIVPTAIAYSTIIHAYAQGSSPKSLELAEEFLARLASEEPEDNGLRAGWIARSGGRSLALDTLYQPLMHVYARLQRVEDVERLQQELLYHGGTTTLGGLAALLAAYRSIGDVAAGKDTWSLIYDMASKRAKLGDTLSGVNNDREKKPHRREVVSQSNILCIPLSIYIDLLSSTGHHAEVAEVWYQLRTDGFTFDSHNWNHLTIALIRAGEPERAFAILERVILPNTSPASSTGETEYGRKYRYSNSPLSIVGRSNKAILTVKEDSAVEPSAWAETTAHRYNRRMEGVRRVSGRSGSPQSTHVSSHGDFAQHRLALQLIPFTWNSWRPHPVTLSVLSHALARLASGAQLHPIQRDPDTQDVSADEPAPTPDPPEVVLQRIYTNYRGAVRAVREFERWASERPVGSTRSEQSIRWM